MSWNKVKPWQGKIYQGCSCCPPVEEVAPMNMLIAVGFGDATVTKDEKLVFRETPQMELDDLPDLQHFEDMALADPDHDWRVTLMGALRGRTYQRHEAGKWVLIESNQGFA